MSLTCAIGRSEPDSNTNERSFENVGEEER